MKDVEEEEEIEKDYWHFVLVPGFDFRRLKMEDYLQGPDSTADFDFHKGSTICGVFNSSR